jgi:hypothetical protein
LLEEKVAATGFSANQGKAEEVKGLRFPEPTLRASVRRLAAKFDQAGLVRMQSQRKLL